MDADQLRRVIALYGRHMARRDAPPHGDIVGKIYYRACVLLEQLTHSPADRKDVR